MAFVLKEGSGSLFRNDKEGVETRPDYRGELNIGGTVYRVSGWIKDGAKGKWLSLSAEVPRAKLETPQTKPQPQDDDPIPF